MSPASDSSQPTAAPARGEPLDELRRRYELDKAKRRRTQFLALGLVGLVQSLGSAIAVVLVIQLGEDAHDRADGLLAAATFLLPGLGMLWVGFSGWRRPLQTPLRAVEDFVDL